MTKKMSKPHAAPAASKDFQLVYDRDDAAQTWARIWNHAPKNDYTLFVQAPPGSYMATDPLAEVGCPYVVRGFDFDYVGVLWLSDLVWRGDHWVADHAHIHESAWKKTRSNARKENGSGPSTDELVRRLQRCYRILLSRAIRGAYVWIEDAKTRAWIERSLQTPS